LTVWKGDDQGVQNIGEIGRIFGVLLGMFVLAVIAVYVYSESCLNTTYDVPLAAIPIPSDSQTIARGQHLVATIGFCGDCHGENLAGKIMENNPLLGRLVAPNLTSGKGGASRTLSDADFVRAIRHGIKPDGKPLIVMASNVFYIFGDRRFYRHKYDAASHRRV
jgi:hypothetical protein